MIIGLPKEIKVKENRVALTPSGVNALVAHGHTVLVETNAGVGSGFPDGEYTKAGASVLNKADSVWEADLMIKVKEPLGPEFNRMRKGQILFTYLHLAADEALTRELLDKEVIGIAYETIQLDDGSLPLLAPMSEVAGRLSLQMGCMCLESKNGGAGILLSGVAGVPPAKVTIIGAGIAGTNACHLAVGVGAEVAILDINAQRLRYIQDIFKGSVVTVMSNKANVWDFVTRADLVIGSILIPGAKAQKLIPREMIKAMRKGSAFIDIAIDQGGCADTSKPTTHDNPIYIEDGVVHYCVANMPGAVPRTSTYALTNVTLSYIIDLADKGLEKALRENKALYKGLNVYNGTLTYEPIAQAFGMSFENPKF